ncbi:protein tramtrack, beta isoform isoform X8 [Diabrotica virgifera virgifera]|uniref:Protein tramtrack, beta isoform-like isoform X8 n=1 Tax=Diabrotica virgifera virgifera TaxID=50390 RepID=A0A6P7GTM4_DIAVI|nr:protein tramtrack, beta isoform isoform X8 [Diabrotica virgifera virgifera]
MSSEQFSLCWDNFHKNMSSGMNSLLENEDLVDVTLAVQGKCLKAHKMVLSVCSPYFKELFKSNPCKHPIVFMKDVSYEALSDLLQFMYQGEVQVSQENLTTFIKTAEALQIKGLTGDGNGSTDSDVVEVPAEKRTPHVEDYKPVSVPRPKKQQPPPAPMSSPSVKRQRLSASTSDTQPLPPPVTKVEPIAPPQPVPISTPESSPLHFKTEPYEQSVSLLDETGDDTFNEDTLDETVGDDNEDYSMMESGSGEEPQAGTSTDGAGEGQEIAEESVSRPSRRVGVKNAIVIDGFTYHQNTTKNSKTRYLVCAEYKRLACKARAVLPVDGSSREFVLRKEHNHPPLIGESLKGEFIKQLKRAIVNSPLKTPRDIYEDLSEV